MDVEEIQVKAVKRKDRWFILFTGSLIGLLLGFLAASVHHPQLQPFFLVVILSYSFVSALRFLFYVAGGVASSLQKNKNKPNTELNTSNPKISIIMPAFNEEQVIAGVLRSCLRLNYSNFEIVVVDDGSSDKTFEVASIEAQSLPLDIKVFKKTNAGKAEALNFGISKCQGDFVLCMDADSILSPDTLDHGIYHFHKNPKLAAVAGVVCAENTSSLLGQFQQLDYLIGHYQRKILSIFGKVSIVPGPIGLFRKRAILSVGGYEKDKGTFAEDTELTFRLIAAGWQVQCEDKMIAYTEAPDNVADLLRQRYRWSRGVYQALFKNINNFIYSQSPSNLVFLMYLLWEQVLVPIVDFALLTIFIIHFLFDYQVSGYSILLLYIMALDIVLALFATWNQNNHLKWIGVALMSRFSYVNILLVWKLCSFYEEWKDTTMEWDKLDRKGFLNTEVRL